MLHKIRQLIAPKTYHTIDHILKDYQEDKINLGEAMRQMRRIDPDVAKNAALLNDLITAKYNSGKE